MRASRGVFFILFFLLSVGFTGTRPCDSRSPPPWEDWSVLASKIQDGLARDIQRGGVILREATEILKKKGKIQKGTLGGAIAATYGWWLSGKIQIEKLPKDHPRCQSQHHPYAFHRRGSSWVGVCPVFFQLRDDTRAQVLIHEWAHVAGYDECGAQKVEYHSMTLTHREAVNLDGGFYRCGILK